MPLTHYSEGWQQRHPLLPAAADFAPACLPTSTCAFHPPTPAVPPVYSGIVDDDTSVPVWPDGYPRGNYRVMVYALAWTAFACSLLTIPLGLAMSK